jgi:dipeptidyl aminopeptidase/acylaminoacyl peptidase
MKKWWILLCVLAVLVLVYGGISWYFSNQLLYPPLMNEDALVAEYDFLNPGDVGLEAEEVTVVSADENALSLSGWWIDAGGDAAFILVHGRNSNRKALVRYAPIFVDRGISVLLLDLRGHGDSDFGYATFGDRERYDVMGAAAWLADAGYDSTAHVGIMGISMGGAASILAAMELTADDPDAVDALIFDSVLADVPASIVFNSEKAVGGAAPILLPGALFVTKLRSGADFEAGNPMAHAADMTVPALFIMHTADDMVPVEDQQRLFETYGGPKEEITFEGLGHHRGHQEKKVEYETAVDEFLTETGFMQ